jgi:hypothetical protein
MTNRIRVSGTLGKRLKESKVSPDAVLRQAGLSLGLFQQTKILLTTDEMFALYHAIEKISGDPGIGLKLGSDERPEHYSQLPSPRSTPARFAMRWSVSHDTNA